MFFRKIRILVSGLFRARRSNAIGVSSCFFSGLQEGAKPSEIFKIIWSFNFAKRTKMMHFTIQRRCRFCVSNDEAQFTDKRWCISKITWLHFLHFHSTWKTAKWSQLSQL